MLVSVLLKASANIRSQICSVQNIIICCHRWNCNMSGSKPSVLFVLGAPGSGKGTQCSNITEKFNFAHLSAGDLLRAERNTPGSPYGGMIEEHIRNGTIVPVEVTCSLIDRAMQASPNEYFLIDGFPRNKNNLDGWVKEMSNKVTVLGVLFFECPVETCMQRCLARGAAGSGRSDDNEESLRKRFLTYNNDTMPIVHHYEHQDLVHTLNADRIPSIVFDDVEKILQTIAPKSMKD